MCFGYKIFWQRVTQPLFGNRDITIGRTYKFEKVPKGLTHDVDKKFGKFSLFTFAQERPKMF